MASSDADVTDDYEWQPPTEAEMKILQARRERSDKISKLMGDYLLKGYKMLGICCTECGTILLQDKQQQNYCVACNELASDTGKDDPVLSQEAARRQAAEERQRQMMQHDESPDDSLMSSPDHQLADSSTNRSKCTRAKDDTIVSSRPPNLTPEASSSTSPPGVSGLSAVTVQPLLTAPKQPFSAAIPIQASARIFSDTAKSDSSIPSGVNPTAKFDVSEPIGVVNIKLQWATRELQRSGSIEGSIQLCHLIKACAETLGTLYSVHDKNNNGAIPKDRI